MNRIEAVLQNRKQNNKKALLTYITAGLPTLDDTKDVIQTLEEAGASIVILGVPFSDPLAHGTIIKSSIDAIDKGVGLKDIFKLLQGMRKENIQTPIILNIYYNTIVSFGVEKFVEECIHGEIDGVIIPDLPFEEQYEINEYINQNEKAPILVQFVSTLSKARIANVLKDAKGFACCIAAMGSTEEQIVDFLDEVKTATELPQIVDFGTTDPEQLDFIKTKIDGVLVSTKLVEFMEENLYDLKAVKEFLQDFTMKLNL